MIYLYPSQIFIIYTEIIKTGKFITCLSYKLDKKSNEKNIERTDFSRTKPPS